jgi:thiol-disulfide isomerase/thioredoxin
MSDALPAPDPTGTVEPPRPRRRVLALAGLGGVSLAAAAGLVHLNRSPAPSGPATLPAIAYPIIDGRRIGPETLKGRVVLVNFWATSCAVCVAEMPVLTELYDAYRPRGLELLAVAMPYDRPDHVLHFAATRKLAFPVALDPVGDAVRAWGGVEATPLTWLVAPDGRVLRGWYGRPEVARLRRELDALLPARG